MLLLPKAWPSFSFDSPTLFQPRFYFFWHFFYLNSPFLSTFPFSITFYQCMEFNPLSLNPPFLNKILLLLRVQPLSFDLPFLSINACCYFSFNLDIHNRPFSKLKELDIVPTSSPFIELHTLKPCINVTSPIVSKFHTLNLATIHVPLFYNSWCSKSCLLFCNNCCNNLFLSFVIVVIRNHILSLSTTTHVYTSFLSIIVHIHFVYKWCKPYPLSLSIVVHVVLSSFNYYYSFNYYLSFCCCC